MQIRCKIVNRTGANESHEFRSFDEAIAFLTQRKFEQSNVSVVAGSELVAASVIKDAWGGSRVVHTPPLDNWIKRMLNWINNK